MCRSFWPCRCAPWSRAATFYDRYRLGVFSAYERAVAVCKRIVDRFLADAYKQGQTAEDLWRVYRACGEDLWIATTDPDVPSPWFSASGYARERCQDICHQGM